MKKGTPSIIQYPFSDQSKLNYSDIRCGRAFLTLLYVKSNPVTIVKSFEADRIDP